MNSKFSLSRQFKQACQMAVLGLLSGASFSAHPPLVQAAFDAMQPNSGDDWSFTQTTSEVDAIRVERCERREQACDWTLITVDGHPPTEKQAREYQEQKSKQKEEREAAGKNKFETLAEPGSIVLLEESEQSAVYSFTPLSETDDDAKVNKDLVGRLVIAKAGPFVESFELSNTKPISPAPFVKLHQMQIQMVFAPVSSAGPYLPVRARTNIKGKIGGLKKITQEQEVVFSGYLLENRNQEAETQ